MSKPAFGNAVVQRGLGWVRVQVAQQFSGINKTMYYSPTLIQLAGFTLNRTVSTLSLVTSGLNAAVFSRSMLGEDHRSTPYISYSPGTYGTR
ncbi:hypothetical protein V6N13_062814 [Hibiscus sabdariffa]|uniref:Uncharacterized protein n=2 Tax=Hibiscus sabdariffa TaxID=183260 RepID=A0ABR1ZKX0_9ROSI